MNVPTIDLLGFSDYRAFLLAYAKARKELSPKWTYGSWARRLGVRSTSSLTKILHGQREPGPEIVNRFVRYFSFTPRQERYFRDLAQLNRLARDPRFAAEAFKVLDDRTFSVISGWHCLPIRELVRSREFAARSGPRPTPREGEPSAVEARWLARRFRSKLTARETGLAIRDMLKLGLLTRDSQGRLRAADARLNTSSDVASQAIRHYHSQMLDRAREALTSSRVTEREITSSCLLMSEAAIPRAKELIREFKSRFCELLEDDAGDAVYQVQIQLFPLTHPFSESKES